MSLDEIIEMARQAGFYVDEKCAINDGIETAADFSQELNVFAKLVAAKERELIQDEYWMCVNSDLENGVKSLNEKAAERFTTYFPELSKFGSWLEARGEQA
jgi:hypothetical protein